MPPEGQPSLARPAAGGMFEFVVNSITDPISVVDETLTYRLVNDAWCAVTRRPREAVIGRKTHEVFPLTASAARRLALLDCIENGSTPVVRGPNVEGGAGGRVMETTFFPYTDPQAGWRGAVVISRDITEMAAGQAELSASLDNLRLTLNATGDAIFATDAASLDEPVLFSNDQLCELWGIAAEHAGQVTGRMIVDHARALFADPGREIARIDEVIASGTVQEDRVQLCDGRVLVRRCIPTEREGRRVRVWGFRDITRQAQAEQRLRDSEARLHMLLDALPGYISAFDAGLDCLYVNDRLATLLGTTPEQMTGLNASLLIDTERLEELRSNVHRALAGEVVTMERHFEASAWQPVALDLLVTLARGESLAGRPVVYAFGTDIAPLKRTEAALTAARDEAERASRAKSQFLSNMSHELRTPLNAVLGFAQVLELNTAGNLDRGQLRQLGEIRRAGEHLLALIDDLLDLTGIEAGRAGMQLGPVAIGPLLDECVQLVRPQAEMAAVRLELPLFVPTQRASADTRRLKQVVLNLLSNAVKYNRRGGLVTLSCQVQADSLRIEVRDTGPGLAADECARLFRPFERLGAQRSTIQGTGIGLALSHQLVELMGGQIGVDSQPGVGSCFWVSLPLASPADSET